MSKENGFLPLRRGLWEHVRDGRMSITEALAFIYICSQADTRTGIWKGSAGALAGELGVKTRTARDVLEKMEHGDYIRRFAVPGRHICYPILIHKFPITQGEHDGEHLNALASTSPVDLTYFPREQSVEQDGEHGVEHSAAQRRIEKLEGRHEKKTKAKAAARTAPPADPRHKQVLDSCFEAYRTHYGEPPTWGGKEGKTLSRFLKEHPAHSDSEIFRRYKNLLDSTDRYHGKEKHGSLCRLLQNFDTFAEGPMLPAPQRGSNGNKPTISDNFRVTLAAMQQSKLPA